MSCSLVSVDQSLIAVLQTGTTTETAFSLVAGGPAVLSMPSSPIVDGQIFQLTFAGKAASAISSGFAFGLYLGNSATLTSNQQFYPPTSGSSPSTHVNFFGSYSFLWDSTSQLVTFPVGVGGISYGGVNGATPGGGPFSSATQTAIQFVLSGKFHTADASNAATLTEFKISYL